MTRTQTELAGLEKCREDWFGQEENEWPGFNPAISTETTNQKSLTDAALQIYALKLHTRFNTTALLHRSMTQLL